MDLKIIFENHETTKQKFNQWIKSRNIGKVCLISNDGQSLQKLYPPHFLPIIPDDFDLQKSTKINKYDLLIFFGISCFENNNWDKIQDILQEQDGIIPICIVIEKETKELANMSFEFLKE